MRTIYKGDARYEKIKEQMDLLGIIDSSTERQVLNGTIVWRLPYKSRGNWVEYGSFTSGYVRNQGNQCHSNWQINKRYIGEPQYYPDYRWCEETNQSIATGKFNRYYSKQCITIPVEIDRLEYMMKYIVKNEFIKRAKMLETDFVPKWQHERLLGAMEAQCEDCEVKSVQVIIDGQKYKVI